MERPFAAFHSYSGAPLATHCELTINQKTQAVNCFQAYPLREEEASFLTSPDASLPQVEPPSAPASAGVFLEGTTPKNQKHADERKFGRKINRSRKGGDVPALSSPAGYETDSND